MKSAINLEYICIKPRPQCHFLFASFVLSLIFPRPFSILSSSWFHCFKYSNIAKYFVNTVRTTLFTLQNVFLYLLLNVDSNCMGSIGIVNVALKEKSMGAKETKEFYFPVKQQENLIKMGCHL